MAAEKGKYGWKVESSRSVYRNPWISVREDQVIYPNGRKGIYGVVEKGPGVAVVPLDDEGNIFLVRQYRYTVNEVFLELPAGAVNQNENGEDCASRELFEEMEITAGKFELLGNFYTALGHETAEIIVYLATGLDHSRRSLNKQQHDESILEIVRMPAGQLKKAITSGEIKCGITLAALNLFFLKHPDL